jgi:hypothetical protein
MHGTHAYKIQTTVSRNEGAADVFEFLFVEAAIRILVHRFDDVLRYLVCDGLEKGC